MARTKSVKRATAEAVDEIAHPKTHGYEFGGPLGAFGISFGLPILTLSFAFLCNDVSGCPVPSLLSPSKLFTPPALSTQSGWQHALEVLRKETGWPGFAGLLNIEAVLGTLAWHALSLLLLFLLPATEVEGTELRTGGRLKYRFNGLSSALVTLGACAAGTWVLGTDFQVWTFINKNYVQILTTNIIIAFVLSVYVYLNSFSVKPGNKDKREIAAGGHTGNIIYDWYIGRELNPRVKIPYVGEWDIKTFYEVRPGLLGWIILDLAFMAKQYKTYGYVTDSMLIVVISQLVYVLDCYWYEPAITTQIDIAVDGFGFMLSFGDIAWLPFIYSTQARYLSVHPIILGPLNVVFILVVAAVGYYIFRASNGEKDAIRRDPSYASREGVTYITTSTGSKLLTSGWWGRARHVNYLGDWLMSWAYCLPTMLAGYKIVDSILTPGSRLVTTDGMVGTGTPFTYFFMLYFGVLLVHREMRDDEKCRRKYGKDWEEYTKKVPWRIIPYVY